MKINGHFKYNSFHDSELMNFTGSDLNWLTDNDNTTCNNGSLSNVTVSLLTPIPLTWIRAVFKKVGTVKKGILNRTIHMILFNDLKNSNKSDKKIFF